MGWLGAIIIRQDDWSGAIRNIAAGIAGALLAGLVLTPALGGGNLLTGGYHVSTLLISLFGAVVMLAGVNLLRREDISRKGDPAKRHGRTSP